MSFKKATAPVIATALFLVIVVVSVSSFQRIWPQISSSTFSEIEKQSNTEENLRVEGIIGSSLYLKSGKKQSLNEVKILNTNGKEVCNLNNISFISSNTLQGWWKGENNSLDSSKNTYDGIENGSMTYVKGIKGLAFNFDGIDDYINFTDVLDPNGNNFSMSLWIKYTGSEFMIISKTSTLFDSGNWGITIGWSAFISPPGGKIALRKSSLVNPVNSNDNNWHHVVGIHTTTIGYLYVDGELVKSGASGLPTDNNYDLLFGMAQDGTGKYNGQLDDVRIYNKTLTTEEIEALYSNKIYSGINNVDLYGCNLEKNKPYQILIITNTKLFEQTVIAK